ncbi:MAG: hypothetical protein IPH60_15200 [Flavobacteriales bacterium]|nr:hypothetical protein [Flavobacteriales bacterium]
MTENSGTNGNYFYRSTCGSAHLQVQRKLRFSSEGVLPGVRREISGHAGLHPFPPYLEFSQVQP